MATKLVGFDELPPWQQDNAHIRTGYRRETGSWAACAASIFQVHNESVNILSHLLGAVVFAVALARLLFVDAPETLPSVNWKDTAVFACFYISGITCLGLSATFHTCSCHSDKVAATFNRLDYCGIAVLIVGSFWPAVFYGYFCHPHLQLVFLSLITVLGLGAVIVVVAPRYRSSAFRRRRTHIFIALGLSAVFPVTYAWATFGWHEARVRLSLGWLVASGAFYIVGALLYAERCPECFSPGSFDIVGASHQIFHILILLAAWCHQVGVSRAYHVTHHVLGGQCVPLDVASAVAVARGEL